jgi:hypothetical protein
MWLCRSEVMLRFSRKNPDKFLRAYQILKNEFLKNYGKKRQDLSPSDRSKSQCHQNISALDVTIERGRETTQMLQ